MSAFLTTPEFPYCKGCGHHLIARNTARALDALPLTPLDVVLVTDIGCHGIVDGSFATHTVHGLHGRSAALAAGIALGAPARNKVLVYIGDGGATIGLQHLLEAARLNVDVTVILHNNMLYGMTGGQPSGLTPCGFRTIITPEGSDPPHHDVCRLARDAGAAYVARVVGLGDYSHVIRAAIATEGFALVEVLELCTSYGVKLNPGLRLQELAQRVGCEPGVWSAPPRARFRLRERAATASLLDLEPVPQRYSATLPAAGRVTVVLGGSAGEGVQRAAEALARAGLACGLQVARKSSYPVTVGVGFSTAEVILARDPIDYHGIVDPDAVLITSEHGLRHNLARIRRMERGTLWLDAGLPVPETRAEVRVHPFREQAGPQGAARWAVRTFLQETGLLPVEALKDEDVNG